MRETDLLGAYLAEEAQRPFEWSSLANGDCQLFLLGWAERLGWRGVKDGWRGRYGSEEEARDLIEIRGGLVAIGCELFGPPRVGSDPRRGDIGLLAVDGWHVGLICTGCLWVLRAGLRGVCYLRREPDICWDMGFNA